MSEMVDRVAKAIYDAWPQKSGREFSELRPFEVALATTQARAVLAAMREPTEAMIAAANRNNHPRDIDTWCTMIDAALAEP